MIQNNQQEKVQIILQKVINMINSITNEKILETDRSHKKMLRADKIYEEMIEADRIYKEMLEDDMFLWFN